MKAIATAVSPSNGTTPVSSSYRITPTEYRSDARADRVALRLLGREVLRGAHDRARQRHVRGARARDPEVGDPRAALLVEDHVVRLQVAVDDAALCANRAAAQDLHDDVDRPAGSSAPCSRTIVFSERPGTYSIAM